MPDVGSLPVSLLSDFPRGDPDRAPPDHDPRGFKPPAAAFTKPAMLRDALLGWEPGKLFLGMMDGTVHAGADGRNFVAGGRAIGVTDDRHIWGHAIGRAE